MIRHAKSLFFIGFVCLLIFSLAHARRQSSSDYSVEEAFKVFGYIEQLEKAMVESYRGDLNSVVVTESELNSYIAYRIEDEKEEIMKQLHLKIFLNNRVEGKIMIDLRGQKIPKILRPEMNFYFAGKVEIKGKKVRLLIKKLFIEDQPIKLKILNAIIFIACKIDNTDPWSLYDWYDLPFGIKDIRFENEKAFIYY